MYNTLKLKSMSSICPPWKAADGRGKSPVIPALRRVQEDSNAPPPSPPIPTLANKTKKEETQVTEAV